MKIGGCMKTLKGWRSGISLLATLWIAVFALGAKAEPLLNGVAVYTELGSEKFIAGLYTSRLSSSADAILAESNEKRIELRVLDERLSNRRFKRMWIEGIAINSGSSDLEKHAENMATFSNMLKVKLKRGDIFRVDRTLDKIIVSVDGVTLGEIADTSFFDMLLKTWIGYVPLSSDFRDNLLKQGDVKADLLSRYERLQPSPERVALLQEAILNKQAEENGEQVAGAEGSKKDTKVAVAPVKVPVPAPVTTAPKPSVSQPKVQATPKPTPKPKPKATPRPTPKPEPVKVALPPSQQELDESIFDDEEDGDVELTAENLLIQQLYYSRLANYTQNFARYPRIAQERGRTGSLLIRVTIDREGNVLSSEFIEETDSYSLNKEAKRAVKRASPFPPMPSEISGDEFSFMFRLTFNLAASDTHTTLVKWAML